MLTLISGGSSSWLDSLFLRIERYSVETPIVALNLTSLHETRIGRDHASSREVLRFFTTGGIDIFLQVVSGESTLKQNRLRGFTGRENLCLLNGETLGRFHKSVEVSIR